MIIPPEYVDPIPEWVYQKLILKLEEKGVASRGWINCAVVNDYKPGGMIVSHIDPPHLFARPIFICSFFATGRLSFGASFGFLSAGEGKGLKPEGKAPKFTVSMPRGSLVTMDGYSANGITHGIRPIDLDGRRVSIILRHVFTNAPRLVDLTASLPAAQRGVKHEEMRGWLQQLDGGTDFLLEYARPLSTRFSSPTEVAKAYLATGGTVSSPFFDEFKIRKIGHRRLFMRWFAQQEKCLS